MGKKPVPVLYLIYISGSLVSQTAFSSFILEWEEKKKKWSGSRDYISGMSGATQKVGLVRPEPHHI